MHLESIDWYVFEENIPEWMKRNTELTAMEMAVYEDNQIATGHCEPKGVHNLRFAEGMQVGHRSESMAFLGGWVVQPVP